jgi:hypothetical protein
VFAGLTQLGIDKHLQGQRESANQEVASERALNRQLNRLQTAIDADSVPDRCSNKSKSEQTHIVRRKGLIVSTLKENRYGSQNSRSRTE